MTTLLLLLILALILLTGYLAQIVKQFHVSSIGKDGKRGQEHLVQKTRWSVFKDWLRVWAWGVMAGVVVCPACGWWAGWLQ